MTKHYTYTSCYNKHTVSTADTGSVRIKVAYCVKRVRFPYLGNDSDGR